MSDKNVSSVDCGITSVSSSPRGVVSVIHPALAPTTSPRAPPGGDTATAFLWWPIVVAIGGAAVLLACLTFLITAIYRRRKETEAALSKEGQATDTDTPDGCVVPPEALGNKPLTLGVVTAPPQGDAAPTTPAAGDLAAPREGWVVIEGGTGKRSSQPAAAGKLPSKTQKSSLADSEKPSSTILSKNKAGVEQTMATATAATGDDTSGDNSAVNLSTSKPQEQKRAGAIAEASASYELEEEKEEAGSCGIFAEGKDEAIMHCSTGEVHPACRWCRVERHKG